MKTSFNASQHLRSWHGTVLPVLAIFLAACTSTGLHSKATLELSHVPPAAAGGPEQMDTLEGRVNHPRPGQQILVYAKDGIWWLQPFSSRPFTLIQHDGTFKSATHLGSEYAAVLVEPGYHPLDKLSSLPAVGDGVDAIHVAAGGKTPPPPIRTLHFSGYDWTVRAADTDRGGEMNSYDPANAWTDNNGYLHLRMGEHDGRWSCAEVSLTRPLGYGTYKFDVQDSAHLSTSGVLGLFTVDERLGERTRVELDIELSQWGMPGNQNAQYVVQPYYIPVNISRFTVQPGEYKHMLRWEPGTAAFSTTGPAGKTISSHTFTSGIPVPAAETVHLDLYDFYHSKAGPQAPSEVVIKSFEYLP